MSSSDSSSTVHPVKITLRHVPGDSNEIAGLFKILCSCGDDMAARHGLRHWSPPFSAVTELVALATERNLWALEAEGLGTVGMVVTGNTCNVPYLISLEARQPGLWAQPSAPAIYVAKLAIRPELQGRGLGAGALAAVEAYARAAGACALRLDALRAVPNLPPLYSAAGYTRRGEVSAVDAHGTSHVLDVWERVLT